MPKVDEDFGVGVNASFDEEEKKSELPSSNGRKKDSEYEDIRESELLDATIPSHKSSKLPTVARRKNVQKTDLNSQMFQSDH